MSTQQAKRKKVKSKGFMQVPEQYIGMSREQRRSQVRIDVLAEVPSSSPISVFYLATQLDLTPQAVTQALRFLEKDGHVVRIAQGQYRRVTPSAATPHA